MATAAEIEKAIAILIGGRITGAGVAAAQAVRAEKVAFKALSRPAQARAVAVGAGRGAKFAGRQLVTKNPYGMAALLAYEGYIHRDEIGDVAETIFASGGEGAGGPLIPEKLMATRQIGGKRKVSKANKAVKHAMGLLKAGTKRSTGADKGKLSKGAFKIATKAAGLANPNTKSVIGKGKSITKAIARKLKKWWK